jgi:pSer/pThr/pTyr-binding forkhead associated (FHA) protein
MIKVLDTVTTPPSRTPLDHDLTVGHQAMPGQLVLDHPNVSRCHAAFDVSGGTVVLRDLGGTNGTYVNGVWYLAPAD